jgi:hypothetical protein
MKISCQHLGVVQHHCSCEHSTFRRSVVNFEASSVLGVKKQNEATTENPIY